MLKPCVVSCAVLADAWSSEFSCESLVAGSEWGWGGWFSEHCKCPKNFVIFGSNAVCQAKWNNYQSHFYLNDEAFMGLVPGECECKHRPGCGIVHYTAEQVLPSQAALSGLPPAVEVGSASNMNIGVQVFNDDWSGVWWMEGNPFPEELVSFAGAYSRLSPDDPLVGDVPLDEVDWPLKVSVPNGRKNRWAWPEGWLAKQVMRIYTDADGANNFTMSNATDGVIGTGLVDFPLVWVESFTFHKIDEHRWLRPTNFQDRALYSIFFGNTQEYTLTRIVDGNGEATEYFATFQQHMGVTEDDPGTKLMVWDSDSSCKRSCMLRNGATCEYCHSCCTFDSDCEYS